MVLAAAFGLSTAFGCTLVAQEAPAPPPPPEAPLLPFLRSGWNELDASWVFLRLNFQAFEDGAFYWQDAASEQQVEALEPQGLLRIDDLSLSGTLKFPRPWRFVVGGNYRGLDPTGSRGWTTADLYLSIPLPVLGSVTLGKQKQGVGLEMSESGRHIPFMERSTMSTTFAFVNSHILGVRLSNAVAAGRMTWSAGWFNNWLDDDLSFDQSGQIFAGRVTGLAVEDRSGRRLLHLGVSGVYREAPDGHFRLKSVPEVYEAPDFVDTGSFPAESGVSIGGELAAVEGPVMVSGEYSATKVSSPETGDPRFSAFYVAVSWALTGETRPYDHENGTFGAIHPIAPFSFKHGGPGAWELAARYSSVDLTSGLIDGGKFERWSGALSWYPTSPFRFEFDYGYGRLRRSGLDGRTNFYQLRLQFQL